MYQLKLGPKISKGKDIPVYIGLSKNLYGNPDYLGRIFYTFFIDKENGYLYCVTIFLRRHRFLKRLNNPEIFYKALSNICGDSHRVVSSNKKETPKILMEFIKVPEDILLEETGYDPSNT